MARHRLPAALLELRGAFQAHPNRRRVDVPGAGPLDPEPREWLTAQEQTAWRQIVDALAHLPLSSTEELGIVQMARIWAAMLETDTLSTDFKRLDGAFRAWAIQMGMSAQARLRFAAAAATSTKGDANRFDRYR